MPAAPSCFLQGCDRDRSVFPTAWVWELHYVDVHVHVADLHVKNADVHGADVCVHGADVHGADVHVHGADVRGQGAGMHVHSTEVHVHGDGLTDVPDYIIVIIPSFFCTADCSGTLNPAVALRPCFRGSTACKGKP